MITGWTYSGVAENPAREHFYFSPYKTADGRPHSTGSSPIPRKPNDKHAPRIIRGPHENQRVHRAFRTEM